MLVNLSHSALVVIFAGTCSGTVIGAFLTTQTEVRARQTYSIKPALDGTDYLRGALLLVLSFLGTLVVVSASVVCVGLVILRFGGLDRVPRDLRQHFGLAVLVGASGARYMRYLYWKPRA